MASPPLLSRANQRLGEGLVEGGSERRIDLGHCHDDALLGERGHAMLADAARDDAAVMREIGIDIEGDAVKADPMAHADADGGDLLLAALALVDPDADAARAPLARHVE